MKKADSLSVSDKNQQKPQILVQQITTEQEIQSTNRSRIQEAQNILNKQVKHQFKVKQAFEACFAKVKKNKVCLLLFMLGTFIFIFLLLMAAVSEDNSSSMNENKIKQEEAEKRQMATQPQKSQINYSKKKLEIKYLQANQQIKVDSFEIFLDLQNKNDFKYLYSVKEQQLKNVIGSNQTLDKILLNQQFANQSLETYQTMNGNFTEIVEDSFMWRNMSLQNNSLYKQNNYKFITFPQFQQQLQKNTSKGPESKLFQGLNESEVPTQRQPQKGESMVQNKQQWIIPNILWTYLDSPSQLNDHQQQQLENIFIQHLSQIAQKSNFTFILLNQQSIHELLNKEEFNHFNGILQNIPSNNKNAVIKNIIKLEMLYKYGGLWIDQFHFMQQNSLQWLINIALNKSSLTNSWQDNPKTFMFHRHQNYQWFRNMYHPQTIQSWQLNYETFFIATEPQTQLVSKWKEVYLGLLRLNPKQITEWMWSACRIKNDNISSKEDLFPYALRCVLNIKQFQINQRSFENTYELDYVSSCRYFQFWSISSIFSHLKISLLIDYLVQKSTTQNSISFYLKFLFQTKYQFFKENYGKMLFIYLDHNIYKASLRNLKSDNMNFIEKYSNQSIFHKFCLKGENLQQKTNYKQISMTFTKKQIKIKVQQYIKQLNSANSKSDNLKQKQPENSNSFDIPKFVWTWYQFPQSITQQSSYDMSQLKLKNLKYYPQKSGYKFVQVNNTNYQSYLQDKRQVQKLLNFFNEKFKNAPPSTQVDQAKIKFIMYLILHQNGGIYIDSNASFVDDLSWIEKINQDPLVNKRSSKVKSQYIIFFKQIAPSQSDGKKKMYPNVKQVTKYPGFQNIFMAGVKQGQFLQKMLKQYSKILIDPSYIYQRQRDFLNLPSEIGFSAQNAYKRGDKIAFQFILHEKDLQLNLQNHWNNNEQEQQQQSKVSKDSVVWAIEYFGIYSINSNFGPSKFEHYNVRSNRVQKLYQHYAKQTFSQLEKLMGPFKYIVFLDNQNYIQKWIEQAKYKNNSDLFIMKQSLLGRLYFPVTFYANKYDPLINKVTNEAKLMQQNYLFSNQEHSIIRPNAKPWRSLPRVIWLVWHNGLENSTAGNQLCVQNIKRTAKISGFAVHEVHSQNINLYLNQQQIEQINGALFNAKMNVVPQTISDFWRSALILKYGGVYMDASYFFTQSIDFIPFITRYQSNLIYNRFGQEPQALMMYNMHRGSPYSWTLDLQHNTKAGFHYAYENSFIAAIPKSNLVKDWYQYFKYAIVTKYDIIVKEMKNVGHDVFQFKWTYESDRYLTSMDSIKYILGRKQKMLQQSFDSHSEIKWSGDYYKFWSLNGFMSQQKLRQHTNYQENLWDGDPHNRNLYFIRYPIWYSDLIIGRVPYAAKFFGFIMQEVNLFIKQNYANFQLQVHPESYFMKFLLNNKYDHYKFKLLGQNAIMESYPPLQ